MTAGSGASEGVVFEAAVRFFTGDNWPFSRLEGETALQMAFRGESGRWMCFAQAREDAQQFVFYSIVPVTVPAEKRQAMAEYLTRANYGLVIGNFEMDFGDGELRYKTSLDVEGIDLRPDMIRSLVYANVTTTDRYLPGVLSVIDGRESPAEAAARADAGVEAGGR